MPGSLARRGNDRVWTASASGLSSCHRHHASAMRAIAISLVFALFWRDCEKKSEQLMSGGCLREILRFLDVARTRAGFSKAWNIKDFRLLTVLGDGDWFLKNRGKVPWGRDIQTFFSISRWNRSHRRDIEIPPGGHMAGIAAVHKPTTCRAQCNLALRAKARVSVRQTSAEYRVTSSDETT